MRPAYPERLRKDTGVQALAVIHIETPAQQRVRQHQNGERRL